MKVLPFIYAITLNLVMCFNIGYVYKDDSASEKQQFEIFSKYLDHKMPGFTVQNKEYSGSLMSFIGALESIAQVSDIQIVFVNCTDEILQINTSFMERNNKIIWCTNLYNIGICHHNIVSGNSIVSPLKESIFYSYIYLLLVDFLTALTTQQLAVITGTESEYDSFWPTRIKNLGRIYGQEPIYNENNGSLQENNITYFKDLLNTEKYKNKITQAFVTIRNKELMKLLINEIAPLSNVMIMFFMGGLTEKEIIEVANGSKENLNGHSILHIYNDDATSNNEYDTILTDLSLVKADRLNKDDDVFMYVIIIIINIV